MSKRPVQLLLPRPRSPDHDAVRVLMILHIFGKVVDRDDLCRVLDAEYHIHKTDFYLRNPDYLAWALLDQIEKGKGDVEELCRAVTEILTSREPELRRIPMQRLYRGAYESLSDVEVLLVSRGLIVRRSTRAKRPSELKRYVRTTYSLTTKGCDLVAALLEHPEAQWYHGRCELIARLLGTNIPEFKRQQYTVHEYVDTPLNQLIPSIAQKVRARAAELCGVA